MQRVKNCQKILKEKKKAKVVTLSDIKIYCKDEVIKTVLFVYE